MPGMTCQPPIDTAQIELYASLSSISKMTACGSTTRLVDLLLDATRPFGVATYAIWATASPGRVDPLASMLSNLPDEWAAIYSADPNYLYHPVLPEAAKQTGQFFTRDIAIDPQGVNSALFKQARQYGMIDVLTNSGRGAWPVVVALSLSGQDLAWTALEERTVSLMAHTFMSRSIYLRAERVIPAFKTLRGQQLDVLKAAAAGASDDTIADRLTITPGRLATHWQEICTKLAAKDRAESIGVALWSGQLEPPQTPFPSRDCSMIGR